MTSRLPAFERLNSGVYIARQVDMEQILRDQLAAEVQGDCGEGEEYSIGNECEIFNTSSKGCVGYYAFYIDENLIAEPIENADTLQQFIWVNSYLAIASLTVQYVGEDVLNDKIVSINKPYRSWLYSYCEKPFNNGFSSEYFVKTIRQSFQEEHELFVSIDTSNLNRFLKLLWLYSRCEFRYPYYKRVFTYDELGQKTGSFWVCILKSADDTSEFTPGSTYNYAVETFNIVSQNYSFVESTKDAYFLPGNYRVLREFLTIPHEYGGGMGVESEGDNRITLAIRRMATNMAQCEVNYMKEIDVNGAIAQFHTHPAFCYNQLQWLIGTPSVGDFIAAVKTIGYGTNIHQVCAREGVYTYQLTDSFKIFLLYVAKTGYDWSRIIEDISNAIAVTMQPMEGFRSKFSIYGTDWYPEDEKYVNEAEEYGTRPEEVDMRERLLRYYNTITFRDISRVVVGSFFLYQSMSNTDFPLFDVDFVQKSDAERYGVTLKDFTEINPLQRPSREMVPEREMAVLPGFGLTDAQDSDSELEPDSDSDRT